MFENVFGEYKATGCVIEWKWLPEVGYEISSREGLAVDVNPARQYQGDRSRNGA
jgi:hypothetical protein